MNKNLVSRDIQFLTPRHPRPLIAQRGRGPKARTLIEIRLDHKSWFVRPRWCMNRVGRHASPPYESSAPSFDDLGETFEGSEALGPVTHAQMTSFDDSTIRVAPGLSQRVFHFCVVASDQTERPSGPAGELSSELENATFLTYDLRCLSPRPLLGEKGRV